MMEKDNTSHGGFEKAWQQAFENAEMDPPNHLWTDISQQLDTIPSVDTGMAAKTISGKFIAATGTVLLVVATFYYFNQKTNNNTNTSSNQNTNNYEAIITKPTEQPEAEPKTTTEYLAPALSKPARKHLAIRQITTTAPAIQKAEAEASTVEKEVKEEAIEKLTVEVQEIPVKELTLKPILLRPMQVHAPIQYMDNNSYFDPKQLHQLPPTKGGLFDNVKVRAGVRVSN